MSKQFQVKRIESLLAPSLCSEFDAAFMYFGGLIMGAYSLGLAGYIGLACYYL